MKKYNQEKIKDILTDWGKKSRVLPENKESVKENVLNRLHSVSSPKIRPSRFLFLKIVLAGCAGVAAIIIFVNTRPIRMNELTMSSPALEYAEDGAINIGLGGVGVSTGLSAQREVGMLNKVVDAVGGYFTDEASVVDTREYLKLNYSAEMKTRTVEKKSRQIETMVRGYGGRIDSLNVNNKYANISFVLPKKSLDLFQNELRGLVREKYFSESLSSNNLLPQKQNIEKNTENNLIKLSDLQAQRDLMTKKHEQLVAGWQKEINGLTKNISELRAEVATDTVRQRIVTEQIRGLTERKNYLNQKIVRENVEFQNRLDSIDGRISQTNQVVEQWQDQDEKLLADVETVQCNVFIRWISVWDMVNLYVPVVRVLVVVFILVIVGYFVFGRRQRGFDLP